MFSPSVEILAFTAEQACRLTGLSARQLSYWDNTEFFSPGHHQDRRGAYARLYTFRDIVGLRAIAILRNTRKIPLQELRRVGAWLAHRFEDPWASLTFYIVGHKVAFLDPTDGTVIEAGGHGQTVIPIALEPIARDMENATQRLRRRPPDAIGKIKRHRHVAHNAHVVEGTRIPTRAIWEFSRAGYDEDAILREYPRLTKADVLAALTFEREKRRKARKAG